MPADDVPDRVPGLAEAVGAATGGRPSRTQLQALVTSAARSARAAGGRAVASGRWLAETAVETAAHLPMRDLATLQAQHAGLGGTALATELIHDAARAAGAVGAAAGALAAVSELTPATWVTLPVELAAETLIIVAIEMKLVAELHEVAGRPIGGPPRERAVLVATAWSERRGTEPQDLAGAPLALASGKLLGRPGRSRFGDILRRRMIRKASRSITSFVPFLAGAAAGAVLNRRATTKLGGDVARSLGLRTER